MDHEGDFGNDQVDRPPPVEPDILLLTPEESRRVLPLIPLGDQYRFYVGGTAEITQKVALGILAAVIGTKLPLIGAIGISFPIWGPWAQAFQRNVGLVSYPTVGLWRTAVLRAEVTAVARMSFEQTTGFGGGGAVTEVLRVTIGDREDGTTTDIEVPMRAEYWDIREGDVCELVVVSERRNLQNFRAVKDIYLPACGLWLRNYPFLDRVAFRGVIETLSDW